MDEYLEEEVLMFRVMFNTTFVQSYILMLTLEDIDTAWDAKDRFPKDFNAEVRTIDHLCFMTSVMAILLPWLSILGLKAIHP